MRGIADALMGFVPVLSELRDAYRLYEAIEKLQEVQKWQGEVRTVVEWHHGEAQHFGNLLGKALPRTNKSLDGRIKALEEFYAAPIPNTTG
jgi:hypothetical protein